MGFIFVMYAGGVITYPVDSINCSPPVSPKILIYVFCGLMSHTNHMYVALHPNGIWDSYMKNIALLPALPLKPCKRHPSFLFIIVSYTFSVFPFTKSMYSIDFMIFLQGNLFEIGKSVTVLTPNDSQETHLL